MKEIQDQFEGYMQNLFRTVTINSKNFTQSNELNYQVEEALNDINLKYTKEYIISMRYVDYYIEELNLVIEVDGDIHYEDKGQIK